jgi:HAD superfamily hydrolase (TIGR01509 family)
MPDSGAVARLVGSARAVIFDLDGVVIDSEPLKAAAYADTFGELFGAALPESDHGWRGLPEAEVVTYWARALGLTPLADPADVIARKRRRYRELFNSGALRLIPGVDGFLAALARRGTPAALATTSNRADQEAIFARFGLGGFFRTAVTLDDITRPKPDPEVYRRALERLGLPPEGVVAFEDTPAGASAALAARLETVAVLTSWPRVAFPRCRHAVHDFTGPAAALAALPTTPSDEWKSAP